MRISLMLALPTLARTEDFQASDCDAADFRDLGTGSILPLFLEDTSQTLVAGFIWSQGCASDIHTSICWSNQLGSSRLVVLIATI